MMNDCKVRMNVTEGNLREWESEQELYFLVISIGLKYGAWRETGGNILPSKSIHGAVKSDYCANKRKMKGKILKEEG